MKLRTQTRRYQDRKKAGLCIDCPGKADSGCVRCLECRSKRRVTYHEAKREANSD